MLNFSFIMSQLKSVKLNLIGILFIVYAKQYVLVLFLVFCLKFPKFLKHTLDLIVYAKQYVLVLFLVFCLKFPKFLKHTLGSLNFSIIY